MPVVVIGALVALTAASWLATASRERRHRRVEHARWVVARNLQDDTRAKSRTIATLRGQLREARATITALKAECVRLRQPITPKIRRRIESALADRAISGPAPVVVVAMPAIPCDPSTTTETVNHTTLEFSLMHGYILGHPILFAVDPRNDQVVAVHVCPPDWPPPSLPFGASSAVAARAIAESWVGETVDNLPYVY